jgi:hypothetical protein
MMEQEKQEQDEPQPETCAGGDLNWRPHKEETERGLDVFTGAPKDVKKN